MQCLYHVYLEEFEKCVTIDWESSGSLDSDPLDVEGRKAAQRNESVVPGQNITFSSKRRLIRMLACAPDK